MISIRPWWSDTVLIKREFHFVFEITDNDSLSKDYVTCHQTDDEADRVIVTDSAYKSLRAYLEAQTTINMDTFLWIRFHAPVEKTAYKRITILRICRRGFEISLTLRQVSRYILTLSCLITATLIIDFSCSNSAFDRETFIPRYQLFYWFIVFLFCMQASIEY